MAIFDPAIFDGTTGGLIFDDGGSLPAAPLQAIDTVDVLLVPLTVPLLLAETTVS